MSPGDGLPSRRRLTCPGLEQGNGERRDAFASSNEAHALVGFRLDRRPVRVNAHRRSELPLHPGDVRGEQRPLGDDSHVNVHDLESSRGHHPGHRRQEHHSGRIPIAGVARRKQPADVTEGRRAAQRVYDGMGDDISIAPSVEPLLVRNLDSSENEAPARREPVTVVSEANSHACPFNLRAMARATARSSGVVTLRLS